MFHIRFVSRNSYIANVYHCMHLYRHSNTLHLHKNYGIAALTLAATKERKKMPLFFLPPIANVKCSINDGKEQRNILWNAVRGTIECNTWHTLHCDIYQNEKLLSPPREFSLIKAYLHNKERHPIVQSWEKVIYANLD